MLEIKPNLYLHVQAGITDNQQGFSELIAMQRVNAAYNALTQAKDNMYQHTLASIILYSTSIATLIIPSLQTIGIVAALSATLGNVAGKQAASALEQDVFLHLYKLQL